MNLLVTPVSLRSCVSMVLVSIFTLCVSSIAFAQDLNVEVVIPNGDMDRLSVCGDEQTHTMVITNTSSIDLTDVVVTLSDLPIGIFYVDNSVTGATIQSTSPPSFLIGNLNSSDQVNVTYNLDVSCEGLPTALDVAAKNYDVDISYTGGDGSYNLTTPSFELSNPSLSFTSVVGNASSNNVLDAASGLIDTLKVTLANGGNGNLREVTYVVANNNPLLSFNELRIGDMVIPPSNVTTDSLYFTIGEAQFTNAIEFAGNSFQDPNLFQFNEQLQICEIWEVTDCPEPGELIEDIRRRAYYGCDGMNECESSATSGFTGVRFGTLQPTLYAREYYDYNRNNQQIDPDPDVRNYTYEQRETWNECSFENGERIRFRHVMENTGDAPLRMDEIAVGLTYSYHAAYRFVADSYSVYPVGDEASAVSIQPDSVRTWWQQYSSNMTFLNACHPDQNSPREVFFQNEDIVIPVGEIYILEFEMEPEPVVDCGSCSQYQYAYTYPNPTINYEYSDECSITEKSGVPFRPSTQLARVRTFPEGDDNVFPNQEASFTWNTTYFYNSFWHFSCPTNGQPGGTSRYDTPYEHIQSEQTYIEDWYIIPEGMDWTGVSGDTDTDKLVWVDAKGEEFPIYEIEYTDNNSGPDTVIVRYQGVEDVCFTTEGSRFELKTTTDCSEASPFCQMDFTITKETHFVQNCEASGNNCFYQIDVPRSFSGLQSGCDCDPCEGMAFNYLTVERSTFGLNDSDNDGIVDPGSLDESIVNKKRYLSGDTLQSTFGGVIGGSQTYDYGYAVIDVPPLPSDTGICPDDRVTPLDAEVEIWDASSGARYTCDLVRLFPDGNKVVADFSIESLRTLGCGLPADYSYAVGDSVSVQLSFSVRDYTTSNQNVNFGTEYYVSDAAYGEGSKDQCNSLSASMLYVGYAATSVWRYREINACEDGFDNRENGNPTSRTAYPYIDNHQNSLGTYANFEYFPNEVRQIAVPVRQTYVNQSDLDWGTMFWFSMYDLNGSLRSDGSSLTYQTYSVDIDASSCITKNDNVLVVDYTCLFEEVGYERFDQGIYLYATPTLNPSCESEYNSPYEPKTIAVTTEYATDESIFCTPTWTDDDPWADYDRGEKDPTDYDRRGFLNYATSPYSPDYLRLTSLPNIDIQPFTQTQVLYGENGCFQIDVNNIGNSSASNVYFTFENESGQVIFQNATDFETGEELSEMQGVVELGSIDAGESRVVEFCFTSNNCSPDSIVVNAGWACDGLPTTPQEAQCTNSETLYVETVPAQLGMVVLSPDPSMPYTTEVCGEMEYVVELSSSNLGALHDINFRFNLVPGTEFVDGSFEIAYPVDVGNPTWVTTPQQPTTNNGSTYRILLDDQLPALSDGLPGTTDIGENFMWVRYRVYNTCGVVSGSRTRFSSWAFDACDQLANYRVSPGPRILINGASESYFSDLATPDDVVLNACNGETFEVGTSFFLANSSLPIGQRDSVLVTLPEGLSYVPGSYTPGNNAEPASGTNPIIQDTGGGQLLLIDLQDGVTGGNSVDFTFELMAMDVGQSCTDYEYTIMTFNSQEVYCESLMTNCDVRSASDFVTGAISIIKPELSITDISVRADALPPDQELLDYCYTLLNTGAPIAGGTETTVEFYDDVNDNGDFDAGVDVLLTSVMTTEAIPANGSIEVCNSVQIPSGMSCNILAVINPEVTCACDIMRSTRANAELTQNLPQTEWAVCSNELIENIGPMPLDNVDYEWVGIGNTTTQFFSSTTTTPTTFQYENTTGTTQVFEYYLRSLRNDDCASFDTISIMVYPEEDNEISLTSCSNVDFELSGPTGNTNYQWTPVRGLDNPYSPTTMVASSEYEEGNQTFVLTYTDVNGCPGMYTVNANLTKCADSYIGNYVWCDDGDGIQDDTGLPGITVQLFKSTDLITPIGTAITDADGWYQFGPLPQGEYVVGADLVGSNYQVPPIDATDDDNDSDINANTFKTQPFYLSNGDSLTNIDLGILCPEFDVELVKNVFTDEALTEARAVIPGNTVYWEVAICNRMLDPDSINFDVDSLVVREVLPQGVTYVSHTTTDGTYDQTTGLWAIDKFENATCDTLIITSTVDADAEFPITNVSEVVKHIGDDVDSTPDNDDGDQSEDDEDDATIYTRRMDLALVKKLDQLQTLPVTAGSEINYDIIVCNQGNVEAINIEVVDYIPNGMELADANWTSGVNGRVFQTLTGPLDINRCDTLDLRLRISDSFTGDTLTNFAEISNQQYSDGTDAPDVDSTTDSDPENDGPVVDNDTDNTSGDEDDHDPAGIMVTYADCIAASNGPLCPETPLMLMETGGSAASWAWSGPNSFTSTEQNPTVATPVTAGTYVVTVTDANGFTSECSVDIEVFEPIMLDLTETAMLCSDSNDAALEAVATAGVEPYTYQWSTGANTASITDLAAADYVVTVTDANGCSMTAQATVVAPEVLTLQVTSTPISCNGEEDGVVTVTNTAGGTLGTNEVYEYNLDGSPWQEGTTFTGVAPGDHVVNVRDSNDCRASANVTVLDKAQFECEILNTQDATDCGTNDGQFEFEVISSSDIEIYINGELVTSGFSQSVNPVTITNTVPSNSYTITFDDEIAPGIYDIQIENADGCQSECQATIEGPNVPMCEVTILDDIACEGDDSGSIQVSVTGGDAPYEYSIDGTTFQTDNVFTDLTAGMYTVTVRNQNSPMCVSTCMADLMAPAPLTCTTETTPTTCNGVDAGTITVTAQGGTEPYEYSIDAGTNYQPTNTFVELAAGDYDITVRDANGCTSDCVATIDSPAALELSTVSTPISCNGEEDGTVTVTVMGGTPDYEYSLDGGPWQPGNTFVDIAAGDYTIQVRDANDCIATTTVTIDDVVSIVCQSITSTEETCAGNDGTITAVASGGTGTLTYTLGSESNTSGVFTGLTNGEYTVTVTDENNCSTECTTTVVADCLDLALDKTVVTASPYQVGDYVTYSITVTNEGNIDAYNVEVTDYLPCGLRYDPGRLINLNNNWTQVATQYPMTTIDELLVGESVDVAIEVEILYCADDNAYYNIAEITNVEDVNGDNPTDVDSTPDNDPDNDVIGGPDDEDDHDPEEIEISCESLRGTVFYDLDNNGCQDVTETGVADVPVYIYQCDETNPTPSNALATTTTSVDGTYGFGPGMSQRRVDWSDVTWIPGSTQQSFTNANGDEFTFTVEDPSGSLESFNAGPLGTLQTPFTSPAFYQGDQIQPVNTLLIASDLETIYPNNEITIIGQIAENIPEGVNDVSFKIFDADGEDGSDPRFDRKEQYEIVGYLNGVAVYPTLDINPSVHIYGGAPYIVQGNNVPTAPNDFSTAGIASDNGVVTVNFDSPIDEFRIIFSIPESVTPQPNSRPGFGLFDVEYAVSTTDEDICLDPTEEYYVVFDLPNGAGEALDGYNFSTNEECVGTPDATNVDATNGQSECVNPSDDDTTDGDDDEHVDAGVYPCQSVAGTVFEDLNNDGCQDAATESGVNDVTVHIYECSETDPTPSNALATTLTDSNGDYEFGPTDAGQNLCLDPSTEYYVVFDLDTNPAYAGLGFSSNESCAGTPDADDVDATTGQSDCYDPSDDDDDEHIDAGLMTCESISGTAFLDLNNDGCQDGVEETGVAEVDVYIYECSETDPTPSNALAATVTDADGNYEFGPTEAGGNVCLDAAEEYYVVFDIPNAVGETLEGYVLSTGADVCTVEESSDDVDPTTGQSSCYNPSNTDDTDGDEHIDAGIYPCQSIAGAVFMDMNNDGCQNADSEVGVEGVDVYIYTCDITDPTPGNALANTTTDANGEYEFGPTDAGQNLCLESTEEYYVVFDLDGFNAANGEHSFTTGDSCPGTVDADDVDNTTGQSECYNPTNDDPSDTDEDNHIDAGIYPCQSINGTVFEDVNNNGCQEMMTETGVEGVTVTLYDCDVINPTTDNGVATTTTDGNGDYEFGPTDEGGNVCLDPAKEYYVVFNLEDAGEAYEDYAFGTSTSCPGTVDANDVTSEDGSTDCTPPDPEDPIDGGIYECQRVAGTVFYDMNNDGCQLGTTETGVADVPVYIYTCDTTDPTPVNAVATTTTDANGDYAFGPAQDDGDICLDPAETYYVVFDLPNGAGEALDGYNFSTNEECAGTPDATNVDATNGQSECVNPSDDDTTDGDDDEHVDAGVYPCQSVAGTVFEDSNNDGCQDAATEGGVNDVTVHIYECTETDPTPSNALATTLTDSDGDYEFGPTDAGQNVCLDPSKEYYVVFDLDANPLYAGLGFSSNESCAGTPDADDVDATTGQSDCYDPSDDDDDEHIDAGLMTCESISGTVFLDIDNDGCQDGISEDGVSQVRVYVYECSETNPTPSNALAATVTDADGNYEFGPTDGGQNVCLDAAEEYYVVFDIPNGIGETLEGYQFSEDGSCTIIESADDVDGSTGQSTCYNPSDTDGTDGDTDSHIDAGIFGCGMISGEVFLDFNNDGCQNTDAETAAEGVDVYLYECDEANPTPDNAYAATQTDADGEYLFGPMDEGGNLCLDPAKEYYVVFDITGFNEVNQPHGFSDKVVCPGSAFADDVNGGTGQSECYDPMDEEGNDHIDAGIYPCESLGGTVFIDSNNDGCQDDTETAGLPGVTVEIYECDEDGYLDGDVLGTVVSDAAGNYVFDGTDEGGSICLDPFKEYTVVFVLPDPIEYRFSTNENSECAGTPDADEVDPTTGQASCYDPSDDRDDEHVDAGVYQCQSLGGVVFVDSNNDGCQDEAAGEIGFEDVTVYLYECSETNPTPSNALASQLSDVDGAYGFDSTPEGGSVCLDPAEEYYVVFDLSTAEDGYEFSTNESCAGTPLADDVDGETGQSDCHNPRDDDSTDADDDEHINVGVYPCQSISGTVFLDNNNNGCQDDAAEVGLANATTYLYECDEANPTPSNAIASQMSDADGDYEFGPTPEGGDVCLDPAKEYYVVFDLSTVDDGNIYGITTNESCPGTPEASDVDGETGQSDCYNPNDDDPSDDDDDEHINVGVYPCQSLGGTVFADNNNDGCQDEAAGEIGVANATVYIYECDEANPTPDNAIASQLTDADGDYEFGPTAEGGDVCLDPSREYYVVFDLSTVDGEYQFSTSESCPGTPLADDVDGETGQSDCYNPNDDDPSDDDDDEHINVGVYPCQSIRGIAFLDDNNDGCQNGEAEIGVEGVDVALYECDSATPDNAVATTVTNADGEYAFGPTPEGGDVCLDPSKQYYVQFTIADGEGEVFEDLQFSPNESCAGTPDADDVDPTTGQSPCTPSTDEDSDHIDVGIAYKYAKLGDLVFKDMNGNGIQDAGEMGVQGIEVWLLDCDGNFVESTTTDENGNYLFDRIYPGNYRLKFIATDLAEPCAITFANQGVSDALDSDANADGDTPCINLEAGEEDLTWDLGLLPLAEIGDRVWYDVDGDGIQDATETGIEGVRVELYDASGELIAYTYTDAEGNYLFDRLYPGDYYLKFITPEGYELTFANQGGNDLNDSDVDNSNGDNTTQITTLTAGESDLSWDAGFYYCVPIGDLVWYDVNADGIADATENGINGLKVEIYRKVGSSYQLYTYVYTGHEPNTPSDDGYWTTCVAPGNYYIKYVIPPYGIAATIANVGTDEYVDSDVTDANGPNTTDSFVVLSGDEKLDIGAGFKSTTTSLTSDDTIVSSKVDASNTDDSTIAGTEVKTAEIITELSINGVRQSNTNVLNWEVNNDANVDYYEIQRQDVDGSYETIGKQFGEQSTTTTVYNYVDYNSIESGNYIYRVVGKRTDESVVTSELVNIEVGKAIANTEVSVYPNPVVTDLTIKVTLREVSDIEAQLYDQNGQALFTRTLSRQAGVGTHQFKIDLSSYPRGVYNVKLVTSGSSESKRVILID